METKESTEMSSSRSNNNDNNKKKKMMKGVFHHNWRDWAGLPMPLLFDIMDRMTGVHDYVRFRAVCTSWRTVFLEENISNTKKHGSQPFLLIRSPDDDDDRMVLYSLNNRKIYNFDLQLAADTTYCRGLTSGWLLTSSESKDNANNLHVQLRNPFLSGVIHLPDIGKLHLDRKNIGEIESSVYIWKAALSSDPRLSTEFRVAAIVSPNCSLAVFDSKRMTHWVGDEKLSYFDDVIFFTKTKQFYLLRSSRRYRGYNNGEVLAIHDIVRGRPKLVPVVPPLTDKNCKRNNNYPLKSYLVDDVSSGELLLVHRWENIKPKWIFGVFKLDPVNNTWIPTGLSGKVLFLGLNTSVVRFARDCPGCRPNSIYFTQDDRFLLARRPYGLYEDGVYSLETRSLHRHYTTKGRRSKKPTPPAIWIEPALPRKLLSEE